MPHAHRVLVQAVPVQAMLVVWGKCHALRAQLMRRTAVPLTRELAMPATLAAPQPHAQPVSLASTKNPLAMMSHALRVLVQAVPVQAMPVMRGKRRALHAQLMRRTAVPPTRELATPATLAAPQTHA